MIANEIRFTCFVAMAFSFLLLAIFFPRHVRKNRYLQISHRLLTAGIFLSTVHFALMYFLPGDMEEITEVRIVVNLMFCIPMTHLIFMSYYVLQRKGNPVALTLWLAPILFTIQVILLSLGYLFATGPSLPAFILPTLSALCTLMLLYACAILIKENQTIEREVRYKSDLSFYTLLSWTRYTMLAIIIIYMGLPFVTYCAWPICRIVYSLLFIFATSFYMLSFMSYVFHFRKEITKKPKEVPANIGGLWLTHAEVFKMTGFAPRLAALSTLLYDKNEKVGPLLQCTAGPGFHLVESKPAERRPLTDRQRNRIETAIARFIESGEYRKYHIKKKDVVLFTGLTMTEFDQWLSTTGHQKFNTWLVYLRIEHAKYLITHSPALTSDEIADRCGFCNRQYFQLQFTKLTGTTPAKWGK